MEKIRQNAFKIIIVILSLLTIAGIVKALFVSIDVDESYAVAQAYRLVTGDKIMYDMWEPHQFSAFLPAFFLYPYYLITKGAEGGVIYLRLVGILIHLGFGALLYFVSYKDLGKKNALLILLVHANFLPKWIALPEFELMQYWSFLVIFLLFYAAGKNGKAILYLIAGLFFGMSVLCYPTMALIFPVLLIALGVTKKSKGMLPFTLGTAFIGGVTIAVILINVPFDELPFFVSYILMDSSHTSVGMAYKMAVSAEQFGSQLIEILIVTLICAVLGVAGLIVLKTVKKKAFKAIDFVTYTLSATVIVLFVKTFIGYFALNQNQFYFQIRYVVLVLLFTILALKDYKKYAVEFWYGLLPGILTIPAVFLITNMDINSVYTKLFSAVIAGLFVIAKKMSDNDEDSKDKVINNILSYGIVVSILLCIFACRILLLRVNGCMPVTIKAKTARVEHGAAAGIFVLKDQADAWNLSYEQTKAAVDSGKNVLYIGQEQLFYVTFCDRVTVPSVQGTTVFNEMYERYYEVFPDKYPEIIVKDASFDVNPAYYYSEENEYIFRWINDNFETKTLANTKYYEVISAEKK